MKFLHTVPGIAAAGRMLDKFCSKAAGGFHDIYWQ